MKAVLALVDDHVLLRNALANLLSDLGYSIAFKVANGKEMIETFATQQVLPQLVLMDINMPVMDGLETTLWLKQNHPDIKVLALSMLEDESVIIKMIRNGAKGYVLKDCEPTELQTAIQAILQKGFYHSELVSGKLIRALSKEDGNDKNDQPGLSLSEKELEFLKWACTDYSYKEIADRMKVSPRTVDGYRDALHEKLEVKSRVGMVLFAIKNGIVNLTPPSPEGEGFRV